MNAGSRPWLVRGLALVALVLTLWFAGPRAWAVVAARASRVAAVEDSPRVALDHVGFHRVPPWAKDGLLLGILGDLEPRLARAIPIMDEERARAVQQRLLASPWTRAAELRRRFPDRFVADLELRRPVLEVAVVEGRREDLTAAPLVCLVDAEGVCLPPVAGTGLPRAVLENGPRVVAFGDPHPDSRVRAAAAVAVEWRDRVVPHAPGAPPLVEVDATNLGYRFLSDGRWSEVRVGLRRTDGGVAWFGYGHPPGGRGPRVASVDKARVLELVLAAHPGLAGLQGGDLRFVHRWRDWLLH